MRLATASIHQNMLTLQTNFIYFLFIYVSLDIIEWKLSHTIRATRFHKMALVKLKPVKRNKITKSLGILFEK